MIEYASDMLAEVSTELQARFADFTDLAHGWEHIQRVYHLALHLAEQEHADSFIVGMAALLHDVGRTMCDPTRAHAERSAILATDLLAPYDLPRDTQQAILHAILAHSYRRGIAPETLEAQVLFDADRLDSLGASGVMRWAMTTKRGKWPETKTYHPNDPFATQRVPDNKHYLLDLFFTKLLRVHEVMQTAAGRTMALRRTAFMRVYLQELRQELTVGKYGASLS